MVVMSRSFLEGKSQPGAAAGPGMLSGAFGISHGSGSPVCEPTSAIVAAGTTAATSAPVLAVSHRSGETMQVQVPVLHYGSDGSGSGSSFLTPARRQRSRGTSPAASDAPMTTGSVKRATCETPQADDHPLRMAKPRIEIPPLQGDSSTTEQRLSHIELQVDGLNTFATMIEQTFPKLKELYDRVAVVEANVQNVGNNVEQLVAKSVE